MCKGTQQFVHRSCLDHWRSVKEGFAFSHCTTCKAQFHLQVVELKDNSWRKIKFRLFVARDVFLVFLVVQTAIGLMGGLAYIVDKDGSFRTSINDNWEGILSMHPIPFYFCIGCFCIVHLSTMICVWLAARTVCTVFLPRWKHVLVWLSFLWLFLSFLVIAYGFLAATMAIQRIWQRHYHILTKRELTQVSIITLIVFLVGCYALSKTGQTGKI
ncbi:putative Zinc finger, RING-CH-type, Zinc finger, RING/FYVE/PHD-type [Helianthus debilis subsp. tardiflorus]